MTIASVTDPPEGPCPSVTFLASKVDAKPKKCDVDHSPHRGPHSTHDTCDGEPFYWRNTAAHDTATGEPFYWHNTAARSVVVAHYQARHRRTA